MSDEHGFRAPADAYDRHIGRYGPELARELIAAAGVRPGDRVLDVGCGPGALTGELVASAGQPQLVAAVDPSPPFAAACAERLPGTDVRTGTAEALPFPDDTFDAALAQLVVNFMADATAGVREMARVVRPGGVVGAAVWDYAHGMTLLRRFWDAAAALDPAAAALDEGRTMRFCSPGELTQLLTAAGLTAIVVDAVVVTAWYDGYDDLWAPLEQGVGPSGAYVARLAADARAALRDELFERLEVIDAPFMLDARAFVATGRVAR
jgi:SAM-dependent methyltransferase